LPRHQTLRALIDWSYNLLTEAEQTLLQRLSVFAGGWTLDAAERVCAGESIEEWEVLDLLTSLVEQSLVRYEARDGEARYRLLETVRQYARDRLLEVGEAEALRGRHADYFLRLAEQVEPLFRGPEQASGAARLEVEHDNLRAALAWFGSAEEGAEPQMRLAGALWRFWFLRGYLREGRRWAEEALSRDRHATAPVRAKVLVAAGGLARLMGDYAAADSLLEESIALARAAGQKWHAAYALFDWALLAISQGEYARATARAQECLTLAREVDDPWLRSHPRILLGLAALHQGDLVSARSFFEEHLAASRRLGDRWHIARATVNLGTVALAQGECDQAGALYREALMRCQETADTRAIAACLVGLAAAAAAQAQPERAARLFGAAEALRETMGSDRAPIDPPGYEHTVPAIRAQLGETTFGGAWAEGRALTPGQAIEYALEQPGADTASQ
jgi:non-specific serine/threonine protein kinase